MHYFSATRIAGIADTIAALLADLPDVFKVAPAGGSLFDMGTDRNGRYWTGDSRQKERLACLAIAAGKARWRRRPGAAPNLLVLV